MADKKIEILWESKTHWCIKLPIDDHELILMVDKDYYTISMPHFEYMGLESIVKVIVQLYKDNKDSPVILAFLKFLQQPENKKELTTLQNIFRDIRF